MPLMWVFSVFVILLLLMVFINLYSSLLSNVLYFLNSMNYKKYLFKW